VTGTPGFARRDDQVGSSPLPFGAMRFGSTQRGGEGTIGVVDYRLARRNVISEYRRGRLAVRDVCDAHPELRRAAEGYSRPSDEVCPICETVDLVHVSYVFGPGLPASGRVIAGPDELARVLRPTGKRPFMCYVVEVCTGCAWNHLVEVQSLSGSRSTTDSNAVEG